MVMIQSRKVIPSNNSTFLLPYYTGHSLGGHIAMHIASSEKINTVGLVLLASVACRPHKALGDKRGYPISRWLGLNTRNKYFGFIVQAWVDFAYRQFFKFPRSSKKHEIVWTQERVAHLNWEEFCRQTRSIKCPVLFAYSKNDHLLQRERFEELALLITQSKSNCAGSRVLVFEDGGHNIQKTKVTEIAKEVNHWLDHFVHAAN
jgi:pimeloyl-ACP methyl ester carboxylesterase